MRNARMPKVSLSGVHLRWLVYVMVYAVSASYLLTATLNVALWPAVAVAPVILILVKKRGSISEFVAYPAAGLLAGGVGYALALCQVEKADLWMPLIAYSAVATVAACVPILALVVTIAVVFTRRASLPSRDRKGFRYGSAWLLLVALVLIGECYMFAAVARSCGSFTWGVMGVMLSPYVLAVRPLLAAALVAAYLAGGFFSAYVPIGQNARLAIFCLLALAAAATGFAFTPLAAHPCEPV